MKEVHAHPQCEDILGAAKAEIEEMKQMGIGVLVDVEAFKRTGGKV